jgi:hypothetical protein
MKLVVCYTHGGYEGTWHENLCVEYESKDHFLVAFIDAFDEMIKTRKLISAAKQAVADARASKDNKKIETALEKLSETLKSHSDVLYDGIVVDGMTFPNFQDYEMNNGVFLITNLPDVYELEEWFELNRAHKEPVCL